MEAVGQKFRQDTAGLSYLYLSWKGLNSMRWRSSGGFFTRYLAPRLGWCEGWALLELLARSPHSLCKWPGLFMTQRMSFEKVHPKRVSREQVSQGPQGKLYGSFSPSLKVTGHHFYHTPLVISKSLRLDLSEENSPQEEENSTLSHGGVAGPIGELLVGWELLLQPSLENTTCHCG